MSQLDQDIKDSIAKNLPAQVGDVLRSRLEQADKDAASLVKANEKVSDLTKQVSNTQNELEAEKEKTAKHASIDARETAVKESERDLKVKQAELQLDAEKRLNTALLDVLGKLVRNVEYRSSVFGTENIPVAGHPGGNGSYPTPGMVHSVPVNRTTTGAPE